MKKKYEKWLKRECDKGYNKVDIESTLDFFDENITKFEERDIYQWDAKELEDYIKENELVSNRKKRKESRGKYEVIKETDDLLVLRLDDKDAAAFWGKGTKWCITMLESNYFDNYRDDNCVFFYVIDKKAENQAPDSKVAIVFSRNKNNEITKIEYYLSNDTCVTKDKLPKTIRDAL